MTPTADPASATAHVEYAAAEKLVDGGELIQLAIKPSGWFVVLESWPVLAVAVVVGGGAALAGRALPFDVPARRICTFCAAVAIVRLIWACAQWVGHLYILTSRRVLSVRGVLKARIDECALNGLAGTVLSTTPVGRLFRVGSIMFQHTQGRIGEIGWLHLANPTEVQEILEEAVRHARPGAPQT